MHLYGVIDMKRTLIAFAIFMLVLVPVGCTPATDGISGDSSLVSSTVSESSDENTILIDGFAFSPDELTISAGESVTWINKDSASHNIKFDDLTSDTFAKDGTYTRVFDTAGTYDYICGLHPTMKGKIIVE